MAIVVTCPNSKCGQKLTVDDDSGHEMFECPYCSAEMRVPVSSTPVAKPGWPSKYCHECGDTIRKKAEICPKCGVRQPVGDRKRSESERDPDIRRAGTTRLAAGLCAILLGGFGVHKFMLGYNSAGVVMLLVTLLSCFTGWVVIHIIALIEGVSYLSKSDEEFYDTYIAGRKEWF